MQVAILAVVLFRPLYVITLKQKFNIYIQNHIRSGKKIPFSEVAKWKFYLLFPLLDHCEVNTK